MNYTRCKQRGVNYKSTERSKLRGIRPHKRLTLPHHIEEIPMKKRLNKMILAGTIVFLSVSLSSFVQADPWWERPFGPKPNLEMMQQDLGLSAEQSSQVRTLLEQSTAQHDAILAKNGLTK